jgi:acyl dehydratase
MKIIEKEPIQPIELVEYSGASGDFNPIHTVPEAAKQKGHLDILAHGMYMMGLASQAIEGWFPDSKLQTFTVRFMAPTYPGIRFTIRGNFEKGDSVDVIKGEIEIVDANEERKLKGTCELLTRR